MYDHKAVGSVNCLSSVKCRRLTPRITLVNLSCAQRDKPVVPDPMSARVVAQEASNWYLSHLDPGFSHADNVKRCLRRPVLALTQKILSSDSTPPASLCGLEIETSPRPSPEKQNGEKDDTKRNNANSDWRDYLQRASVDVDEDNGVWNENDQEVYESLERRTRARMDAFLEGCALALPDDPLNTASPRNATTTKREPKAKPRLPTKPANGNNLSLTEALSGYNVSKKSKSGSGSSSPNSVERPTLLVRSLSNVSSGSGVNYPQFREVDLVTRLELYVRCLVRVRASKKECVVAMEPPRAVRARVNAIVVAFVDTVGCVRSLSPVLTKLLQALTKELLAVDTLGGDVCNVLRYVVSEYEKQTSFASLAFLSSPENSAEKTLTPLLLSYVQYLQLNWENLVAECDLERMLSTVLDARMRHLFKTIEFQSIGHLLEVCQGFRSELQHIELPPNMGGMQGGQDVTSRCTDPDAIRQAVRDLQRETITVNGHILPPARNRKELVSLLSETLNSRTIMHEKRKKPRSKPKTVRRSESCPSKMSSLKLNDDDTDDFISSGNEGDTDSSSHCPREVPEEVSSHGKRRARRRNFHLKTVDMVTRRLLIAGSRTGTGGDAFFIVRDLFGDEDVEVVPSKQLPGYGRATKGGTIEIVVRLTSVTIKCHGSFDVFPKPVENFREPLIQVHTTTSETIYLHEVRSGDSMGVEKTTKADLSSDDDSGNYPTKPVLVLQERKTDKTGWRTLSIRPALYEVVEVFNTPS